MNIKHIIYIFLISLLPIIELRGAVPVGAALGLDPFVNAAVSALGNLLPVPFILLFIPKILDLLERVRFLSPVVRWVRRKADKHSGKILGDGTTAPSAEAPSAEEPSAEEPTVRARRGGRYAAFIALLLFVMIPLPGTGAWTGALVAALFHMPKRGAFLSIALGVVGCAVLMTLASYGVVGFLAFLAR